MTFRLLISLSMIKRLLQTASQAKKDILKGAFTLHICLNKKLTGFFLGQIVVESPTVKLPVAVRVDTVWSGSSLNKIEVKELNKDFYLQSLMFYTTSACHSLCPSPLTNASLTEISLYCAIIKIYGNLTLIAPSSSQRLDQKLMLSLSPILHLIHS